MERHKEICITINGTQSITLPPIGRGGKPTTVKYKQTGKELKKPFIVYADFEALVETPTDNPTLRGTSTKVLQKQTCCGYAFKIVCVDEQFSKPIKVYRGEKAAFKFLMEMLEVEKYCEDVFNEHFKKSMLPLTDEELELHNNAEECYLCKAAFKGVKPYEDKVKDHCHVTGKYRGPAHNQCNLNLRFKNTIPVVFHNLRGYDSHFLIQEIGKFKDRLIKIIPNNYEKYLSIRWGKLQFIDSLQFMNESLEKLASYLKASKRGYPNTERFLSTATALSAGTNQKELLQLITQKGVYPYEYIDSFDKFKETELPPIEHFYSSLTEEGISDVDYSHAKSVWDKFKIKNLGEYHNLYIKTDVLLLSDVFENFRKICYECYKLDPAHYFTAPGLSWDAMLKMTGIELELLSDIDMHLFIEKGIRGGISVISKRYAKANNKYIPSSPLQGPSSCGGEPSNYIMYLDANNLYGWAMSQKLATSSFKWYKTKYLEKDVIQSNV